MTNKREKELYAINKDYLNEISGLMSLNTEVSDKRVFNDCLNRAEGLLAIREHNRAELAAKMKDRGFCDSVIDEVLTFLIDENLLSEERYIMRFISSSNKRHPEGKSVMLARLLQKGADKDVAKKILDEVYSEEYVCELIKNAIEKKIKKNKGDKIDENKLFTALTKAGFSFSISKPVYNSEFGIKSE